MSDTPVKRLPLATLELWKRKAAACDEALAYLEGRVDSETAMEIQRILKSANFSQKENAKR